MEGAGVSLSEASSEPPSLLSPAEAVAALCSQLRPVGVEAASLAAAAGRVLAERARADRDSPPADVSAMDGYAFRLADWPADGGWLHVAGEVDIGQAPPPLPERAAFRVFTGGAIPPGADTVVPRERVTEEAAGDAARSGRIRAASAEAAPTLGRHIRRRGENARAGDTILPAGTPVTSAALSALAAFGSIPWVRRQVRVAICTTGDELYDAATTDALLPPFAIRDGNGPTIAAFVAGLPWARVVSSERVADNAAATAEAVRAALQRADVVLLSGGVSMGDHDHVPGACRAAGCRTVYHRLAMRPGKPNFGALGPAGQAVLGLPGNPGSVLAGLEVLAMPALRARAGFAETTPPRPAVEVAHAGTETLGLWWYRPARLDAAGRAHLIDHRGSGDIAGPAAMHGFVEVPPHEPTAAAPRRWLA